MVPVLQVDSNTDNLNRLLASLYRYYPIGMDEEMKSYYSGFNELTEIVKKKMNVFIEDPAWEGNRLFKALKKGLPESETTFYSHWYPSHIICVSFPGNDEKHYRHQLTLEIYISLLTDFYTVIFNDSYYLYKPGTKEIDSRISIQSYNNYSETGIYTSYLKNIEKEISVFFPEKKFIHYRYLKTHKVVNPCCPFGITPEECSTPVPSFSLFDYLFSLYDASNNGVQLRV